MSYIPPQTSLWPQPLRHPAATAAAGMPRGRFLPGRPRPTASPPFEFVSSSLSVAARGKFGLGWGTLLCPAGGDDRTGVLPCRQAGRKDARGEM